MADGISIPGVTNKYNTNELVEKLMEVERIPLKREQSTLETYQDQLSAWNNVNKQMSTLRDSVKSLYSFENPFSNRLATSSDEQAITVDADRNADFGSFKIDVITPATTDRFLSDDIEKNKQIPAGRYTFVVNNKTIEYNFKGGKLSEFVDGINKRGSNIVKASIIGISPKKSALLIESLKEGTANRLIFKNDALVLAKELGMIQNADSETKTFNISTSKLKTTKIEDNSIQMGMPEISKSNIIIKDDTVVIPPRGGFEVEIPAQLNKESNTMEFTYSISETNDITQKNDEPEEDLYPQLPFAGGITFEDISIANNPSETTVVALKPKTEPIKLSPIEDNNIFHLKNSYGMIVDIDSDSITQNEDGTTTVKLNLADYPNTESLVVGNTNTGKEITLSMPKVYDSSLALGYKAKHSLSEAGDAVIKYEGITITRGTNDIDDVVPNITMHLHEKTEKTATIKIEPDTESAKEALITFVGKYNQVLADINILTSNKPEVITELDYLTDEEVEKAEKKLGMFQGDFTLTNGKASIQNIMAGNYPYSDSAEVSMLSQIGISTNASGGYSGYSSSQLRGYLEINESKLDSMLKSNLVDIKNLFGYDSDGDLIIDSGIGYLLDKHLTSWVQTGGIIANKTSTLDSRIETSNKKISKLEEQLEDKEAELRSKYSRMEGTLGNLENQQTTITNFNNQNSKK